MEDANTLSRPGIQLLWDGPSMKVTNFEPAIHLFVEHTETDGVEARSKLHHAGYTLARNTYIDIPIGSLFNTVPAYAL